MTDEIRITRRVALPTMYEFYEIQYTTNDNQKQDFIIGYMEESVKIIREHMGEPTPKISVNNTFSPGTDLYDALHKAFLDPDIVEFIKPNIIRLTEFLKDKDKWNKYNGVFKDAGYKWVKDGKDSRWER